MNEKLATKPILVTGSHRGGTTWVGKMIATSPLTTYIGEVFRPDSKLLRSQVIPNWYHHISDFNGGQYEAPFRRLLSFDFRWPSRTGPRRFLPSRLVLYKHLRSLTGLPRPVVKDPFLLFSLDWVMSCFDMHALCLVRHPAGFVTSLRKANWRFDFRNLIRQPELLDDLLHPFAEQIKDPPESQLEEAALLWSCLYHAVISYSEKLPELEVLRLEDIALDPLNGFRDLYALVGLPYTKSIRKRVREYSASSNPVNVQGGDLHAIRRHSRALIYDWQQELDPSQIDRIRRIVEPVSAHFYSAEDWQ